MCRVFFVVFILESVDFISQSIDSFISVSLDLFNTNHFSFVVLSFFEQTFIHCLDLIAFFLELLFELDIFFKVHLQMFLLSLKTLNQSSLRVLYQFHLIYFLFSIFDLQILLFYLFLRFYEFCRNFVELLPSLLILNFQRFHLLLLIRDLCLVFNFVCPQVQKLFFLLVDLFLVQFLLFL